jgi:hypothetical protein
MNYYTCRVLTRVLADERLKDGCSIGPGYVDEVQGYLHPAGDTRWT